MQSPQPTRRQAVTGAGATLLTLGSVGALLGVSTGDAQAAIVMDSLSIDDAATSTEDGTVPGVWLSVGCEYSFETVQFEATGWEASLIVADEARNYAPIQTRSGNASGFDGTGTFELTGDVLGHDDMTAGEFAATSDGASTTKEIFVRVRFAVLVDSATLTDAQIDEAVDVTVENTGSNAELAASIGGEGEVVFSKPG